MQDFNLESLAKAHPQGKSYFEILRVPSMSLGIYKLSAGGADPQNPHKQDEVYYVLSGKAKLRVEDKGVSAVPGSILFVEAGAEHKFVEIEEDLTLLIFFAPAEQS